MEEKVKDATYYANTDYNQRLEEVEEDEYTNKEVLETVAEKSITTEVNNIDTLLKENDLIQLCFIATKNLSEQEYLKLIDFNDKDILINLARSQYIPDNIADKLIGSVYLVHKCLLQNDNISQKIKEKTLAYMHTKKSIYASVLKEYQTD